MTAHPGRPKKPIAAWVHVVARPGGAEAMFELLSRMSAEAAKDDGTEAWAIHRVRGGIEEFFLYERYTDDDAFAVHQSNDALNKLGEELSATALRIELMTGRLVGGFTSPPS
jgi:quinol monooxygenase YgiN